MNIFARLVLSQSPTASPSHPRTIEKMKPGFSSTWIWLVPSSHAQLGRKATSWLPRMMQQDIVSLSFFFHKNEAASKLKELIKIVGYAGKQIRAIRSDG